MNNKNFVIGVEGQVSSGKTSMCKELIKLIPNTIYLDAGYIYRGIIYAIAKNKIDLSYVKKDPFELMKNLKVEFKIENGITEIYVNNKKIEENEIETMDNSIVVSQFASSNDNKSLFLFAKNIIEEYRKKFNLIVSGRNLIQMYQEMNIHLFITASLDVRVQRRFNQYNGKYSLDEVRKIIEQRDKIHEKAGFNNISNITEKIDLTECKSAKESAIKILNLLKEKDIVWCAKVESFNTLDKK